MVGVYSHQFHDWSRVYFVCFSLNSWVPKFVRAVKCFRLCRFTWRSSKAGSFTISYVELFPRWYDVLYSDNGMYIQYSFVFKVMLYNTSYFVPLRVSCFTLILFSVFFFFFFYSISSIFSFSPSKFFYKCPGIFDAWIVNSVFLCWFSGSKIPPLQMVSELKVKLLPWLCGMTQ